jgi:hypothetical protein
MFRSSTFQVEICRRGESLFGGGLVWGKKRGKAVVTERIIRATIRNASVHDLRMKQIVSFLTIRSKSPRVSAPVIALQSSSSHKS